MEDPMSKAGDEDITARLDGPSEPINPLPPFPVEAIDLPDIELVSHLWNRWLGDAAGKKGLSPEDITPEIAEAIRLATLGMDTDNEAMAPLEKILRRSALNSPGDEARIAEMIRSYFWRGALHKAALDELATGKRRQRANARKSRIDGLQSLIIEIITNDPTVSQRELIVRLGRYPTGRCHIMEGIYHDSETIEWHDKNSLAAETKFSALKDRMSRARKKIRSR
jgi:hypothetical protein